MLPDLVGARQRLARRACAKLSGLFQAVIKVKVLRPLAFYRIMSPFCSSIGRSVDITVATTSRGIRASTAITVFTRITSVSGALYLLSRSSCGLLLRPSYCPLSHLPGSPFQCFSGR